MSRRRVPYWAWGLILSCLVWNPFLLWWEWHAGDIAPGPYAWPALATLAVAVGGGALADRARGRRIDREREET